MISIQITEATLDRLKRLAVPFEDTTPDDVIQRLLDSYDCQVEREEPMAQERPDLPRPGGPAAKRLPRGIRLPMKDYFGAVLEAVYELGGKARTNDALSRVEGKIIHLLPEVDLQLLPSGGDIRWRNRAQWARKRLITIGYMKAESEWGIWELT